MRGFENKVLEIEDMGKIEELPLAILLQKPCCRKIYRVDKTRAFIDETCTTPNGKFNPFPSVTRVEESCRKYGAVVEEESFKNVKIFPGQTGGYLGENYFYEMCRADFEGIMERNTKTKTQQP